MLNPTPMDILIAKAQAGIRRETAEAVAKLEQEKQAILQETDAQVLRDNLRKGL